jgi:branched-chain amino acid transport system substrate-binding protein
VPQAKIGVLVQNDAYGQNYAAGLLAGLGPAKSKIVDTEKYDSTQLDVSQQIVKLKAAGANVLLDFALPNQSIGALVVATKLGWKPTIFVNNVSSSPLFMGLAAKSGASIDGVFTAVYLKNATDPTQANDAGIKLFQSIMAQYDPKDPTVDSDTIYAMAVAWTFVEALKNAGKTPTRAGLMRALTHLSSSGNPFLIPGIKLQTSPADYFPIEQQQLAKWQGTWRPFGHLFSRAR